MATSLSFGLGGGASLTNMSKLFFDELEGKDFGVRGEIGGGVGLETSVSASGADVKGKVEEDNEMITASGIDRNVRGSSIFSIILAHILTNSIGFCSDLCLPST